MIDHRRRTSPPPPPSSKSPKARYSALVLPFPAKPAASGHVYQGDGSDGFPSRVAFENAMDQHVVGLDARKQEKALITQVKYDQIVATRLRPKDVSIMDSADRHWARQRFVHVELTIPDDSHLRSQEETVCALLRVPSPEKSSKKKKKSSANPSDVDDMDTVYDADTSLESTASSTLAVHETPEAMQLRAQVTAAGGTTTTVILLHENRPVAVREQIYDILVQCHASTGHGGRDKTSAQVRALYSCIPKAIISAFVRMCPTCTRMRTDGAGNSRCTKVVEPLLLDGFAIRLPVCNTVPQHVPDVTKWSPKPKLTDVSRRRAAGPRRKKISRLRELELELDGERMLEAPRMQRLARESGAPDVPAPAQALSHAADVGQDTAAPVDRASISTVSAPEACPSTPLGPRVLDVKPELDVTPSPCRMPMVSATMNPSYSAPAILNQHFLQANKQSGARAFSEADDPFLAPIPVRPQASASYFDTYTTDVEENATQVYTLAQRALDPPLSFQPTFETFLGGDGDQSTRSSWLVPTYPHKSPTFALSHNAILDLRADNEEDSFSPCDFLVD